MKISVIAVYALAGTSQLAAAWGAARGTAAAATTTASKTVKQTMQATPAPTGGFMDGVPLFSDMSSMMQTMAAAIQSIAVGVSSFNDQAMQQISMVQSVFEHDIPSAIDVLRTNSIVNDVLLPFTNFPEFYSGVRSEATRLGSQLDVDLSQAEQQFESFTSVAAKEIGAAVTDVTSLFNSVYSFTQKGIEIMLSSPLLTAATMLNPMVLIVTMVLSADPVKLLTDFPAWEAELSTRQAAVNANYNSLYTFVSTGLPQAENVILGLLSQVAVLGNGVIKGRLQRVGLGWPEGAPDSSNAAANDIDRTRVLLGSNNAMRDAVRSAVYYRLQPGLVLGAVKATTDAAAAAEAIQYMPALVAGHATATDADAGSALPTWAL